MYVDMGSIRFQVLDVLKGVTELTKHMHEMYKCMQALLRCVLISSSIITYVIDNQTGKLNNDHSIPTLVTRRHFVWLSCSGSYNAEIRYLTAILDPLACSLQHSEHN